MSEQGTTIWQKKLQIINSGDIGVGDAKEAVLNGINSVNVSV
jgi:hypothetical protein